MRPFLNYLGLALLMAFWLNPFSSSQLAVAQKEPLQPNWYSEASRWSKEQSYDSAVFYLELAREQFHREAQHDSALLCHYELGDRYRRANRWLKSVEVLELGLVYQENYQSKDTASRLDHLHYLGYMHGKLGNLDLKQHYYREKLHLLEQQLGKTDFEVAKMRMYIGNGYNQKGDVTAAITYLQSAYSILEAYHVERRLDRSDVAINLGLAYFHSGRATQALGHYHEALRLRLEDGGAEDAELSPVYYYLGEAHLRLQHTDSAQSYLLKSMPGLLAMNQPMYPDALMGLARIEAQLGGWGKAEVQLQQALQGLEAGYEVYDRDWTKSLVTIGDLYLKYSQDPQQALELYHKALWVMHPDLSEGDLRSLPQLETSQREPWIMLALIGQGQALHKRYQHLGEKDDLVASLAAYSTAADQVDIMRSGFVSNKAKEDLTARIYALYESGAAIAIELQQLTGTSEFARDAFQFVERSKANYLHEKFREARLGHTELIPDSILQEDQRLRQVLNYLDSRLKHLPEGARRKEVEQQFNENQAAYQRLVENLIKHSPHLAPWISSKGTRPVTAIQAGLEKQDALLIELLAGKEQLIVVGANGNEVMAYSLPYPNAWEEHQQQFIKSLQQPPGNSAAYKASYEIFTTHGTWLYQWLLGPMEPLIEGAEVPQRLIFVTDGSWGELPFELLLTSPVSTTIDFASLPYLFQDFAVSYAHSGSMLSEAFSIPQKGKENNGLLAFGLSYSAGETAEQLAKRSSMPLQPLPFALEELKAVTQYSVHSSFEDEGATKAHFLEEAPNFRIIHLTSHTEVKPEEPLQSSILLHGNKPNSIDSLYLYEIVDLQLEAELVVLSACNTGRGKVVKGEGMQSLARAFTYAGCPTTVMSLWTVNDQSTAALIGEFYAGMSKGLATDEALRKAKQHYLTELASSRTAHPFYWAPMVVAGMPNSIEMEVPESSIRWWLALGILLLLLGAGAWRWSQGKG